MMRYPRVQLIGLTELWSAIGVATETFTLRCPSREKAIAMSQRNSPMGSPFSNTL